MPNYYTPEQVRQIASSNPRFVITANAERALQESVPTRYPTDSETFNIFLSYRSADLMTALGVHTDLVKRGYTVYLDRIMDPDLDRANVTASTVERIRKRLMKSESLFYIATDASNESKWMPWELGFEDGYRGKSAIVPVTNNKDYKGVEFVKVYPRVQPDPGTLWIFTPENNFDCSFDTWRKKIPDRKCGMPKCPI